MNDLISALRTSSHGDNINIQSLNALPLRCERAGRKFKEFPVCFPIEELSEQWPFPPPLKNSKLLLNQALPISAKISNVGRESQPYLAFKWRFALLIKSIEARLFIA